MQATELLLKVRSVRRSTPATRIVRLDLDGAAFSYEAGQAALVGLAGRPERVPYSIASAPEETRTSGLLEFLIRVESSGRWGHLFDRIARGMTVAVHGPFGSFVFPSKPEPGDFLFIAGGTGIAPIRAMIRQARLTGQPGAMRLLYSARSASEFAYLSELRGMARRGELELRLYATREAPPRWRHERGRITLAQLEPLVRNPGMLCFVCGPAAMVHEVPLMLRELGVERSRIRLEEW